MNIDLKDTTFIFIVRLDSVDRLENILSVTDFIVSNFETNVNVYESGYFRNGILKCLLKKEVLYFFEEDADPILHRTKKINKIIPNIQTEFISIWDTDVIAPIHQIIESIEGLRNKTFDIVYPYKNKLLDTSHILRRLYLKTRDISILTDNVDKMKEMYPPAPVGGAFICDTAKYREIGMENEDFYGWGVEDGERYMRWKELNYKVGKIDGCLFHLSHGRGVNSLFHQSEQPFIKLGILEDSARKVFQNKSNIKADENR